MKYTKMVKLYEEDIFKAATPEDGDARNMEYQREYKKKVEEIAGGPVEVGDYILKIYNDFNLSMYLWRVYEVDEISVTLMVIIVDKKAKALYDNPVGVDEGDRYEWRDLLGVFETTATNPSKLTRLFKNKDIALKTYAETYNTYWTNNNHVSKYMQAIDWKEWEGIDEI